MELCNNGLVENRLKAIEILADPLQDFVESGVVPEVEATASVEFLFKKIAINGVCQLEGLTVGDLGVISSESFSFELLIFPSADKILNILAVKELENVVVVADKIGG